MCAQFHVTVAIIAAKKEDTSLLGTEHRSSTNLTVWWMFFTQIYMNVAYRLVLVRSGGCYLVRILREPLRGNTDAFSSISRYTDSIFCFIKYWAHQLIRVQSNQIGSNSQWRNKFRSVCFVYGTCIALSYYMRRLELSESEVQNLQYSRTPLIRTLVIRITFALWVSIFLL